MNDQIPTPKSQAARGRVVTHITQEQEFIHDEAGDYVRLEDMEELEREFVVVLDSLLDMFSQYCQSTVKTTPDGKPMFHHFFMSAGEHASDILIQHGKIQPEQMEV